MRPSLLPGLAAAARRNVDRGATSVRLFEVGRRYLADGEHADARRCCWPATRAPRDWQSGKAAGFDAFDAKAEVLALLEAAGAPVANLQLFMDAGDDLASGPLGEARAGPEDDPRRVRRASSARRQGARRAGRDGRGRDLPRRHPRAAQRRAGARRLHAAGAAGGDPRLRLPRPGRPCRRRAGARGARRRQGADHRRAAVRPLRRRAGAEPGGRGHAAAGREELHRGRDRRGLARKVVAAAAKLGATLRG